MADDGDTRSGAEEERGTGASPAGVAVPRGRPVRRGSASRSVAGRDESAPYDSEGADEIITILDRDGVIRYESPAVRRILGYRPDELVGRNFLDFLHPEETAEVGSLFRRLVGGPDTSATVECRFRHRDDEWRLLRATGTMVPDELPCGGIVVSSRDVTERRRHEEQLRHAQKMEAVGRLAGGVAHDFNNVLTAIHGYAALVLETLESGDGRRDDVMEIMRAAERGTGLSRQLLSFSRRGPGRPERVDLNQVVREAEGMLRPLLGATVDLRLDLSELPAIDADPIQLHQIILNLAVNARDAMPDGGRLTLRTRFLPRRTVEESSGLDARVMLTVEDNGAGMSSEVLERAFEPFYTTKPAEQGTGLGLSTVYGIVHQYGGHVWVYSELGHGTVFKIYLPHADADSEAPPDRPPEQVAAPSLDATLVLVDDEDAIRLLMARALRQQGYTIYHAGSGEEALELLARIDETVDLIVSDVMMPGMSGRELLRQVRRTRPDVRALLLSGYSRAETHEREALEDPFLEKPFDLGELTTAVRRALGNEQTPTLPRAP